MLNDAVTFSASTLLGARAADLAINKPMEDAIVVHGDVQRLSGFASIPSLRTAITVMAAWDGASKTARAWSPAQGPSYEIYATREQLQPLYDAGCTIVLEGVERFVPGLRPFCRSLERDLGVAVGRVNVQVFCAREIGRGRAHFDSDFTFNCQIEGKKTWRLARNPAVQYPPTGMFLGRVPEPQLARLLTGRLPSLIEDYETVIAEPGTVVFVPPGVLHQTYSETGTYAIAFVIEHTDSIARTVVGEVSAALQLRPALRAARLAPQFATIEDELAVAAKILRDVADRLEACGLSREGTRFELRKGLNIEVLGANSVVLRGTNLARELTLNEFQVLILSWASLREAFTIQQLSNGLPLIDCEDLERYIQQLSHVGLIERLDQ